MKTPRNGTRLSLLLIAVSFAFAACKKPGTNPDLVKTLRKETAGTAPDTQWKVNETISNGVTSVIKGFISLKNGKKAGFSFFKSDLPKKECGIIFPYCDLNNKHHVFNEAAALSTLGFNVLVVDIGDLSPSGDSLFFGYDPKSGKASYNAVMETVGALRAAVHHMYHKYGVQKIACAGVLESTQTACLLATVEDKIDALVLIGCKPNPSEHFSDYKNQNLNKRLPEYINALRPIDPIHFINHVSPKPVLLQFSHKSQIIKKSEAIQLSNAAGNPQSVKYYYYNEAGLLIHDRSLYDRINWYMTNLKGVKCDGK